MNLGAGLVADCHRHDKGTRSREAIDDPFAIEELNTALQIEITRRGGYDDPFVLWQSGHPRPVCWLLVTRARYRIEHGPDRVFALGRFAGERQDLGRVKYHGAGLWRLVGTRVPFAAAIERQQEPVQ